jgi:2-polyprenyl-3-methyl-5-hydroxy-6-metoxy-1,4-benzoquinol methylase
VKVTRHRHEVVQDTRFRFRANWSAFLQVLDDDRLLAAERSLITGLGQARLDGLGFLDAGSGSGLFSLAARRLGATVHSFDYDPECVACTYEVKERYLPNDDGWTITPGSVLDAEYLASLGRFDIVYSWGVLPFTGAMWRALDLVSGSVKDGGRLFISIYNDQGLRSRAWRSVKRAYCSGPLPRGLIIALFVPYFMLGGLALDLLRVRNRLKRYTEYKRQRGMSVVRDWLDWLRGFPFEFAPAEDVVAYLETRGFRPTTVRADGARLRMNEFVFTRDAP